MVEEGFAYSCLVYQDIKNKTKIIYIRYFDKPEIKKGDHVLVYGYIENIYTGPGVDGNTIDAPNLVVKSMDILQ